MAKRTSTVTIFASDENGTAVARFESDIQWVPTSPGQDMTRFFPRCFRSIEIETDGKIFIYMIIEDLQLLKESGLPYEWRGLIDDAVKAIRASAPRGCASEGVR